MMQQSFNMEQVNYNIQSVKDTKTTVRASRICCLSFYWEQKCTVIQIQVWKGVFQLNWTSRHAMRLNSRTGMEGPL